MFRFAPALAALLLTGCGVNGLSFTQDQRVEVVSPEDRSVVDLPLTVRWKVTGDFSVTGPTESSEPDSGYFGVFVDRSPVPPGAKLESLADEDQVCAATPGCPDETYLADRNAYAATSTTLVIEELPDLTLGQSRDFHRVTVVLLDGTGRRIGESAFSVEFEIGRVAA